MFSLLQLFRLRKRAGIDAKTTVKTNGYRVIPQVLLNQPRDLPPFTFYTMRQMLWDSCIRLCLQMRAGPIYSVQLAYQDGFDASGKPKWVHGVKAKNPAVAAWVQRQFDTVWRNYLQYILKAQVYGWVGGEVTLRLSEYNLIEIDKLIPRYPGDIRLLKRNGDRSGIRVKRLPGGDLDLNFPYAYFHSFRPDEGEDYGTSILLGAYSAWADKWLTNGALDVRRLFMRKDAYRGMKIAYPSENMPVEGYDQPIPCRDVAMQIAEQAQSGGVMALPKRSRHINGNPKWRIEETEVSSNPTHVMQYPKDCDAARCEKA